MTRRVVIALLTPVPWAPPGIDPARWRAALAEDVVDLLAGLAHVEPAIAATAADRPLASAVAWPRMPVYEVPRATVRPALEAAATDGYDEAAVLAADVPDLPGLLVGKLLRPLSTRGVSVAPAGSGVGLLGLAARLPVPDWLPDVDLDSASVDDVRMAAPRPAMVATAPVWRRLRAPADLATLDTGLDGWPATRALLTG
ncbi:MAG TPA: hypothetical protein VFE14_02370 [Micromonosporaceae bacterium]|nr:hypothetical protein [Micromonosporaceae bacterium]